MSEHDLIYLSVGDELAGLARTAFDREADLQALLARHPALLGGGQLDPIDPVRWLLVSQEAGIPDTEEGGNRWAVDHLFLDQHGRPTFVEVKRGSDTRIRREVVGQMLEYAANATAFWPVSRIRALAAARHGGEDALRERIAELAHPSLLGEDGDTEAYWDRVRDNLEQGRVRLLFVADELPPELRRIIEFLNEHMLDVEVLGVEVGHYAGGPYRALVPRVVGQSEKSRSRKSGPSSPGRTDENAFLSRLPQSLRPGMEALIRGAEERGLLVYWGVQGFSVRVPGEDGSGGPITIFYAFPPGARRRDHLHVQGYTGNLPDHLKEVVGDIFQARAGMERRTDKTLQLDLPEGDADRLEAVTDALWAAAEEVAASTTP